MFDKIGFFIEVCYNICVENKEWGNYNIMEDLKVNLYVSPLQVVVVKVRVNTRSRLATKPF